MSRLFWRGPLRFVEAAKGVVVVKQLQERVHVAPLGLELLRHGGEDDFALVNRAKSNVLSPVQNTSATSGVRKYWR
jgi:hypothetical protein